MNCNTDYSALLNMTNRWWESNLKQVQPVRWSIPALLCFHLTDPAVGMRLRDYFVSRFKRTSRGQTLNPSTRWYECSIWKVIQRRIGQFCLTLKADAAMETLASWLKSTLLNKSLKARFYRLTPSRSWKSKGIVADVMRCSLWLSFTSADGFESSSIISQKQKLLESLKMIWTLTLNLSTSFVLHHLPFRH